MINEEQLKEIEARAIEQTPAHVAWLLAEVERLRAELASANEILDGHRLRKGGSQ